MRERILFPARPAFIVVYRISLRIPVISKANLRFRELLRDSRVLRYGVMWTARAALIAGSAHRLISALSHKSRQDEYFMI